MSTELPQRDAAAPSPVDLDSVESRLERQTLMAAIATRFISATTDEIDAAIYDAMSAIGRYAGFDRVSLALFDEEQKHWSIDHDWFSDGLWSLSGLQEHVAPFRWGLPQVLAGERVEILHPDLLPRNGANDALLLRGLGLGAALLLPVHRQEQVIGFVSAATTASRTEPWPQAYDDLLQLPARMIVHSLDRRVAENRLQESQARWRSICDSNVVGVISMDSGDSRIVDSNDAGLRILGRSREDLAAGGIAWKDYSPPEERSSDTRMRGILARTGRVQPWEKQALRADGTRVPVLCSLTSLAPQCEELISVVIDLSSRGRLAEELRRRDEIDRFHAELSRRLLDLEGDDIEEAVSGALGDIAAKFGFEGAVVCDVDAEAQTATRRTWWHRERFRGYQPEASIDLTERNWFRERLRAGRTSYVSGVEMLPNSAHTEREAMERFGLKTCVSVPLLPGGKLRGYILFYATQPMAIADDLLATLRVFRDIVANAFERLRIDREIHNAVSTLERRVEQRRGQLEASNAELEAFAYSVSHDLRAPLRTIDGMCVVLREDWESELGPDAVGLLGRIQAAVRRMGHLIDGLLALSRVVRTEMEWIPVSLSDLAEGLVDERRQRDPDRKVQVDVAPGIEILGHPRLLRIALEQILDNAFKFTAHREDASVCLEATIDDTRTVVRVRDNGVGFDPDFARKLFGAFQRLHGVEEYEGHGIGLATVERVVRMHGGSAWAEGTPDQGATIFVEFPHPEAEEAGG